MKEGGNLASIHSYFEHYAIRNLDDFDDSRNYWIGFREVNRDVWGWVDGTPSDYGNWDNNQPDHSMSDANNCGAYWTSGYENWHDVSCDYTSMYGFICKNPV